MGGDVLSGIDRELLADKPSREVRFRPMFANANRRQVRSVTSKPASADVGL